MHSGKAITRRSFNQLAAGALVLPALGLPAVARGASAAHVVVIGGGFGGATAAKYLKKGMPDLRVTLIEPNRSYVTCPYSNLVLAGWRGMETITHGYDRLRDNWDVEVVHDRAVAIDPESRSIRLDGGSEVTYDRLIVSPGVDLRGPDDGGIEGYDATAHEAMPHAWKPGEQTRLLRRQLTEMEDGGLFVIVAPPNPFRCPPGPYERASVIADYFRRHKPRSKLLILDAKDGFSKQGLFQQGWERFYSDIIEWVPMSQDGRVIRVDPAAMELETEFGEIHRAAVANVIPPQWASALVRDAGLANGDGWCPVDGNTFESTLLSDIHVIGDASIAAPMPKSGFAANSQGKTAAAACIARLREETPPTSAWVNTCYSHIAPGYAISVAGVYRATEEGIIEVPDSGGVSPSDWDDGKRQLEAAYADAWYRSITDDMFA